MLLPMLVLSSAIDTLRVTCKVVLADTREPMKAKIKYESMPYGNKIGVRNASECSFLIQEDESYTIIVSADGYFPVSRVVKHSDFKGVGSVIEEFEMVPSQAGKLIRLETLIFPQGESTISENSYEELDKLVAMLMEFPEMTIQLEGHTDFRGNEKLNMELSKERVEATRDYLVNKGIEKARVKVKAFGGSQPITRENTPEASRLNRRVEVRILDN